MKKINQKELILIFILTKKKLHYIDYYILIILKMYLPMNILNFHVVIKVNAVMLII